MWLVTWTTVQLAGSPAERDLTRSPLNLPPQEVVADRHGRANPTCGACDYEKTTEHGKNQYFPNCTMVVDNLHCNAALPKGREFYKGATCSALKCSCKDP